MRKPSAVPFFVMILCIATALALLRAAEAHTPSGGNAGSATARSTVRSYYAAVETYFRTGDLSGVRSVFESGDESTELEWSLRALRANYPQLSIDVVEMLVDSEMVTAEIMLDAGPESARLPIQPFQHLRSWRAQEVFQVQGNFVIEYSTVGPGLGLFVPQGALSVDRHPAGGMTLHTARLTFPQGMDSYVALPAPSMITVESGIIEVQGDNVTRIVPTDGGSPELLEPGRIARATSNDALITGNARLLIGNASESQSTLIVATLAPTLSRPPIEAEHAQQRPGVGLDSLAVSGVLVDPLESLQLPDEPIDRMFSGWVVLEPGGAVATNDAVGDLQLIPLTGSPDVERDASTGLTTVSNPGIDQLVVWAVFVS